jgi:hypothetical protein
MESGIITILDFRLIIHCGEIIHVDSPSIFLFVEFTTCLMEFEFLISTHFITLTIIHQVETHNFLELNGERG